MPRTVEIPGVARLTFPDNVGENEMLEATRRFSEQSQQGALPAAGSALMREGGRMAGGAMMGLTRVGLEEPAPLITAAQAESPAGTKQLSTLRRLVGLRSGLLERFRQSIKR